MQVIAFLALLGVASAGFLQGPAAVTYSQPAVAYAHAPSVTYAQAPVLRSYAPAPAVVKTFAAPAVYAAPAPIVKTVAAPAVYAAPAPIAYAAPAPIAYSAPAAIVKTVQPEPFDAHPQYNYGYSVQDGLTGDSKNHQETRDGDVVRGQYSLVEPDGAVRTVTYTADSINGFNAVVDRSAPAIAVAAPVVKTIATPAVYAAPAPIVKTFAAPAVTYAAAPVVKTFAAPAVSYAAAPALAYKSHAFL